MTYHLIDPSDIQTSSFGISSKADISNETLKKGLGITYRYGPARLAIAYAISQQRLLVVEPSGNKRTIKGRQLFGENFGISCWSVIIRTSFPDRNISSIKEFQTTVNALWEFGIIELIKIWNKCNCNKQSFLKYIAKNAGIVTAGTTETQNTNFIIDDSLDFISSVPKTYSANKVSLSIGKISENVNTNEKIQWDLNCSGSSPVMAFMGSMNTGKTETAFQMIEQIKNQSDASFLVLDLKGDLCDQRRVEQTGATLIDCDSMPIPLDAFTPLDRTDSVIAKASQAFRDTFIQVPNSKMGSIQDRNCMEAALQAMHKPGPTTLFTIKREIDILYEQETLKRDTLQNTIEDLCQFELFQPDMPITEFFKRSWIINVSNLTPTCQKLVPFFLIDALWSWYSILPDSEQNGNFRALRNVLIVDEAREILSNSQRSLIEIVRKSRSKGGVTVFMSQSPEDYDSSKEDFLANVGLAVAFKTTARSASLKRVLGKKVDLVGLQPGQCFTRINASSNNPIKVKVW